jgi:hypothetical protein
MNSTPARPGRKPKGNRTPVRAALPAEAIDAVDAIALQEGSDRTTVLGRLLCERLGLGVPDYCLPPRAGQEELPLSRAS